MNNRDRDDAMRSDVYCDASRLRDAFYRAAYGSHLAENGYARERTDIVVQAATLATRDSIEASVGEVSRNA